jgi:hypothetical protein
MTRIAMRYPVFKGVGWSHFPLFIMNDIHFVTSHVLETVSRKQGSDWFVTREFLGRTGKTQFK